MPSTHKPAIAMNADWPVLKTYDKHHLNRIAMPLGGIGTGTVSLGGRGDLRDWEIVNRPAKGFTPLAGAHESNATGPFFALYARSGSGPAIARAIEGPLDSSQIEGAMGCVAVNHGLPRFRDCSFGAAYPLGQVLLSDPDVPLGVRIEAFNPLVPGDVDASSIPCAVLRFVLVNPTSKRFKAGICGTVPNFIGADGSNSDRHWGAMQDMAPVCKENANEFRQGPGARGMMMFSRRQDSTIEQYGTMALAVAGGDVSYRTAWADLSFGDTLLDFWDDFSSDGRIEERQNARSATPLASLAVSVDVPPRSQRAVTFILAWHFPNRRTWGPLKVLAPQSPDSCCPDGACGEPDIVGNYYATQYADAWDVAVRTLAKLGDLEKRTVQFVGALAASDLPPVVKEAALFNVSTLRTQTCFRTADGHLFAWEGCSDRAGCCEGSCTHVWNYEQATAFLFGPLARDMRRIEFLHATDDRGLMSFRVAKPAQFGKAAADGQMGCIMKLYRDWQLCGDEQLLRTLWPAARKCLEFCWIPGGWDADRDGVMEGCQHNTMDVEYFGPNPQMTGWYLGALRAAQEMATHLGETEFAQTCGDLFRRGSKWMDEHLFNGEYYEHHIQAPADEEAVAPGLRVGMDKDSVTQPQCQLGAGCLVDQLVGQYMAHVCGLGYLHDAKRVHTTLQSIMKYNFKRGFTGHFNHMRSFVVGDESALLMATYPLGRRPTRPFPYYTEVMTGFEYTAAVGMLYEGKTAQGLKVIRAIRDRYDGHKRSPFDEAECGHHYGRAMASWAALLAMTGFHYSAVSGTIEFAATTKPSTFFWSNGDAWGLFRQKLSRGRIAAELTVLHGALAVRTIRLGGAGSIDLPRQRKLVAGTKLKVSIFPPVQSLMFCPVNFAKT